MAKTKTCGATITLDEAHGEKTLDCDIVVDPDLEGAPHYGPLHYDVETKMGWMDTDLPLPPEPDPDEVD